MPSVDQLITEGENTKTVHSAYIVSVYVDSTGNMVLIKNPTITSIPKKSDYKPKAIESEGTVDSITTNEINEFLTTFFKLYPTATASELSYYVNDGILKPIGKEYIFQELVNPIYNRKDNQVTVSLTVEYIDQQTKATQVSQFDLVLEKNGSNWKIIGITNIGTLLQLFCNHVLSLIKNWRFLYKYALTCYYLSIYLKGVNKYAARYS